MLKASILFFTLGLLSLFLGWRSLGGLTFELGRTLFFALQSLALASFLASVAGRGSSPRVLPAEPEAR